MLDIEFGGLSKEDLDENEIKFLVKLSIVPKIENEKIKFQINDTNLKNEVKIRALPPVDIIIALNSSYPSIMRPFFKIDTVFYEYKKQLGDFMIENLIEKWSEEMPVLYEMAIYI